MTSIWKVDTQPEFCNDAQVINMKDLMNVKATVGKSLKGILPKISLVMRSQHPPADFFRSGSLYFIVSEKLKRLIESLPGIEIEYFELEVRQGGRIYDTQKYYFGNLMGIIDCFDFENSTYTQAEQGFVDSIKMLVIDETKCVGANLFRVAKMGTIIIGVSETLKRTVVKSGCTGVRFIEPNEWKH